ncbi:MAG: CidA/LrgA family protein [Moraxella sp.]|nr:CidA/LrgA family protein [Moraxella sp.]
MNLTGFLVVFGCLFVGEVFIHLTGLPLPPSIIGLLLLFMLLSLKWVSLEKLQAVAKTMLDYLAFMIVPACISIMQYLDVIKRDAVPLVLGTLLSTLLVLIVTGKTHVLVRAWLKKRSNTSNHTKGGVHGDV